MDKKHLLFLLSAVLIALFTASCAQPNLPTPTPTPPSDDSVLISTPTPTPTLLGGPQPETPKPPDMLRGILEIRFPDPWGEMEYCSSQVPYVLILKGQAYELSGEGEFYCHQEHTFEEGGGMKQHLLQDYEVTLNGSLPLAQTAHLQMQLHFVGFQDGYFSDMPPDVPEMINAQNPFHLEIDQQLDFDFKYETESSCFWNQSGVICNPAADNPVMGETSAWLFILYPQD